MSEIMDAYMAGFNKGYDEGFKAGLDKAIEMHKKVDEVMLGGEYEKDNQ